MIARVLIVDDDAAVLRTLVTTMTRTGHAAVSASNVADAVALLASATFDVVLVDFNLGPESGLDVVRACRAQPGKVFIAMLTGEDDDDVRDAARDAGADLVLSKPTTQSELRRHVAQALAQLHAVS